MFADFEGILYRDMTPHSNDKRSAKIIIKIALFFARTNLNKANLSWNNGVDS